MIKKNDMPAFPQTIDDMGTMRSVTEGMTLRDYFASKVIDGSIIEDRANAPLEIQYLSREIENFYNYRAEHAYKMADAMLKERLKNG